jgi:hypothetical protein
VAGVGLVGLGPPLGAAQRPGVGRLGQVGPEPGAHDLLGDKPPAGGAFKGEVGLLPSQPRQPGAQLDTGGGLDPPVTCLPGVDVQVVVGDLPPVDVEAAYDGHRDLLWLPRLRSAAVSVPHRAEGVPLTCHP